MKKYKLASIARLFGISVRGDCMRKHNVISTSIDLFTVTNVSLYYEGFGKLTRVNVSMLFG